MPLSILLLGLDSNYTSYGVAAQAFFKYFYSERSLPKCSLLRKGFSIKTVYRNGPTTIVANPYGIATNVYDSDGVTAFYQAYSMSANKIKTKVQMVDDNLHYYNKLATMANVHVLNPLSQYLGNKVIKTDTLTQYASLYKLLNGSPHDLHSYLLENSIKALGVTLYLPRPGEGEAPSLTIIEDLAK